MNTFYAHWEIPLSTAANWKNIVLIGMPGVGKSTIGVLLAKALSRAFVDTDVLIQAAEARRLQDIINQEGRDAFLAIEEKHVLKLQCRDHVIATGGSVVYSSAAMDHLKRGGIVVHLDLPLAVLEKRIADLDSRGVVMPPGKDLATLFAERQPLYRKYADMTVGCKGLNHDEVVLEVERAVHEWKRPQAFSS